MPKQTDNAPAVNILVAGGRGQLGSEFPLLVSPTLNILSLGSEELNICAPKSIAAAFSHHKPDVLINAAAYTAVDKAESEHERAFEVNCAAVGHLADACAQADIPLLNVSTDYVFSGDKNSPYLESDAADPQGVYGESKYAGEELLRERWEKHFNLRVSWVFGQSGNNFVKTMLRLGAEREELGVVADQIGGPTAARCIAEGLVNLALASCARHGNGSNENVKQEAVSWGTYHLPSEPYVSWHEFAERIFDQACEQGLLARRPTVNAITTADYPTPAKRPANSRMATEKPLEILPPCNWHEELELVLQTLK